MSKIVTIEEVYMAALTKQNIPDPITAPMREDSDQDRSMSGDISKLAFALSKVQGTVGLIPKTKTAKVSMKAGGSYSYSYADLADIWNAIRIPLMQNELAVSQVFTKKRDGDYLQTFLVHSSGQWMKSELKLASQDKIQELGSSITYLRRYGISSILGIATDEDDDGPQQEDSYKETQKKSSYKAKKRSADLPEAINEAPNEAPNEFFLTTEEIIGSFDEKFKDLPFFAENMQKYLKFTVSRNEGWTIVKVMEKAVLNVDRFTAGYKQWLALKEAEEKAEMIENEVAQ